MDVLRKEAQKEQDLRTLAATESNVCIAKRV